MTKPISKNGAKAVPVTGLIDTGRRRTDYATDQGKIAEIERSLQRDLDQLRNALDRVLRANLTGNVDIVVRVCLKDGVPSRQVRVTVTEQFLPLESVQ